jgi:protein ImuA
MDGLAAKRDIREQLQKEILALQGFKAEVHPSLNTGLGPLQAAFPEQCFPTAAIHELISYSAEEAAATCGFIAALSAKLLPRDGHCLWISTRRRIYPPTLKNFGITPERIIFLDLPRHKEALWALEEALKCKALGCVIAEIPELSFAESRRLQLAVEKSRVTGFLHRHKPRSENTVACVTRWKIRPLESRAPDELPGLGLPRWEVSLLRVRNGRPGSWPLEWSQGRLRMAERQLFRVVQARKTG